MSLGDNRVTCRCDHATTFGVLVNQEYLLPYHMVAGAALVAVGALAVMVVFASGKQMQASLNGVLSMNLAVAILFAALR